MWRDMEGVDLLCPEVEDGADADVSEEGLLVFGGGLICAVS